MVDINSARQVRDALLRAAVLLDAQAALRDENRGLQSTVFGDGQFAVWDALDTDSDRIIVRKCEVRANRSEWRRSS